MRAANDYPYYYQEAAIDLLDIPRAWSERGNSGLGEYKLNTLWAWPQNLVIGLLAKLGISYNTIILLIIIAIFLLAFYSAYKLIYSLGVKRNGCIAGAAFYTLNTYLLLLVDGGQIGLAFAYALLPLAYSLANKSIHSSFRNKIKAGLLISILGFFDFRYIYLFLILIFIKFIYDYIFRSKYFYKFGFSLFVWGSVVFILHAYWLVPFTLVNQSGVASSYFDATQLTNLSHANYKHALFFFQPHWYKNVFGQISRIDKSFIIIPFLVFLWPILTLNKKKLFWVLLSVFSVILILGTNSKFGFLYLFAFEHIPGFSLFRDPTKFYALLALGYSVLIAYTLKRSSKYILILFVVYLIFLARPVFLGQMTGLLAPQIYSKEYESLEKKFDTKGRVLWIPSRPPLGYSSPDNQVVELRELVSRRPFAVSIFGDYETSNFLREAEYIGDLLEISNIKFIAYPFYDQRRDEIGTDNLSYYHIFSKQIENQDYIKSKLNDYPINLFETNFKPEKFFIAEKTHYIYGSDKIYEKFSSDEISLKNNALIFINEHTDEDFIYLSDYLNNDPDESGWWKRENSDFLWVRSFLQEKYEIDNQDFTYSGGYAFAEGERQITIENQKIKKGENLYIRALKSNMGGKISVFQDSILVGKIITYLEEPSIVTKQITGFGRIEDKIFEYYDSQFKWYLLGKLEQDTQITIKSSGNLNVINVIHLSSDDSFLLQNDTDTEIELSTNPSEAILETQKVSPTHYKIKISNLEKPSTLVFSESFDDNWELSGKPAYKVYSMFNGFWIAGDGEYDLFYKPQKLVERWFVISLISAIALILYIIDYGKVNKGNKN